MPESNVYGNVGVPRIYVDYVQLAKKLDLIDYFDLWHGLKYSTIDPSLAWDFNPTNMTSYQITDDGVSSDGSAYWVTFGVYFKHSQNFKNLQFRKLLSTTNYSMTLGMDGTNMAYGDKQYGKAWYSYWDGTTIENSHYTSGREVIVGNEYGTGENIAWGNSIGYTLQHYSFDDAPDGFGWDRLRYGFYNGKLNESGSHDGNMYLGDIFKLGSFSVGRYFDLPHSADVDVSLGFDFSGISRKKTISGDTLTQINYKRPKWGDLRAWTNIDLTPYHEQGIDPKQALLDQDYSTTGLQGRRSWDLSFSYISKDDMFPKNFDGNMAGNYEATTSNFTWDEDSSIVSSWANATLGFQLPFILQVDKNKQDFAIVKAKANSIKVSQQAPMLYKFSITLIEQY